MRLGGAVTTGHFLPCPGPSAARVRAPGLTLLCMGLFSRFLSRPCRGPPKGRYAGSGYEIVSAPRLRDKSIQLQHIIRKAHSATTNSRAHVPWGRVEGAAPGYPAAAARLANSPCNVEE